jgi:hypothetical protein
MTRLLRRKALKATEPEGLRRKANGFLALAKAASKQTPAGPDVIAPFTPAPAPRA